MSDIGRRALDDYVLPKDVTLWIVLLAALGLIVGIVIRAMRAEWKREREEQERPPQEPPQV
jgi:hypothetical protein